MNSWRNPEELLATRAHLPRGIPFEYIYDGAAGGHAQRQVELLGREVGRLTDENERQGALVKELSSELELLYQRSQMDSGSVEAEYRARCSNYETAVQRLRQELADGRADALKLSKIATDDRRRCVGLQADLQLSASQYNSLCTSAENAKLLSLRESEEQQRSIEALTGLGARLEQRASRAEAEAAQAIAEHRESVLRRQLERRAMGVVAVARVHRRRRLDDMKRGLRRWRESAVFERLRAEFATAEAARSAAMEAAYSEATQALRTELEGKLALEIAALRRVTSSRDRLAEERPTLLSAARGLGLSGVIQQWRLQLLLAREKAHLEQIASISRRSVELEQAFDRVRASFAQMCLTAIIPRLQLRLVRRRFTVWAAHTRELARLQQEAAVVDAQKSADKMSRAMQRIRTSASNLVVSVRTRNFIGRAFDCWRIQLEESKLNRIAKFPELWRMSHIADNDETVDEEDSVAKRPKHQHTGDAQGHVARWGAFETVSGSAENPEKKVFFKPIIPFFHAKGNERAALSSGSVGVRDILATGGAVRADIPQINAHPAGTRVMVDFAPMLALPPQVVEAKRVHMTTEVNWQHTGLGVAPADAAYISNEAAMSDDNHRTGLTESEHKKDFPTGLKASKANGLCETFVSPEVGHYTSIRVADITESAVSADQGPGLVWNSQLNEKEDVQNTLNTVAYNLHEESATTAVSSFRRAQSTEHSVVRSAASGASAEGANTSSSLRRSSLTMPTASSAIKAASGIAKRRASVSSEKRQKVEASNRINGDIIKSNSAVSPINAPMDASLFQMTTPDLFNDNILGSKTPEWLRQDTSSDGSGTPMLVHKVLNSPRYEQWAKRVAKVD